MLPPQAAHLEQGTQYRFPKCFYARSGWIKVKQPSSIQQIKSQQTVSLSLQQINQRKDNLINNYITTSLQIVQIGAPQNKQKNGTELTLTILKGFSQNLIVDITVWNLEVPQEYLGKQMLLEGFRVKMLTNDTFVLVSTVYSKLIPINRDIEPTLYDSNKRYRSLSEVYGQRNIAEMKETLKELTKCFSVVEAKIIQASAFDYEGCKNCHKKLQTNICSFCKDQTEKQTFWVCQLQVQDASGACTLFIFDATIQAALKLAKKGSLIKAKIRSTVRLNHTGDSNIQSHILVGIKSINF